MVPTPLSEWKFSLLAVNSRRLSGGWSPFIVDLHVLLFSAWMNLNISGGSLVRPVTLPGCNASARRAGGVAARPLKY